LSQLAGNIKLDGSGSGLRLSRIEQSLSVGCGSRWCLTWRKHRAFYLRISHCISMAQRPRVLSAGEYPIHLYEIDVAIGKFVPHVAEAEGEGSQAWSESHDESALSSPSDEQLSDLRLGGDEIEDSPAVRAVERKLLTAHQYKRSNTSSRRNRNLGRELISNTQSSSNGDQSDDEPESECNSISSSRSSGRNDVGSDADLKVAQAGKQFDDCDSHVEDIAEGSDIDLDAVVSRLPVHLFISTLYLILLPIETPT